MSCTLFYADLKNQKEKVGHDVQLICDMFCSNEIQPTILCSNNQHKITKQVFLLNLKSVCECLPQKDKFKIIYFSGHTNLATKCLQLNDQHTVKFDEFTNMIGKYMIGKVLIILDCCYAEAVFKNIFLLKNNCRIQIASSTLFGSDMKQIVCVHACRVFERCMTFSHKNGPTGAFTYCMYLAYNDLKKKSNSITVLDLYNATTKQVLSYKLCAKPVLTMSTPCLINHIINVNT